MPSLLESNSLVEDVPEGVLLAMPVAVYEMVLAVWLIVKGFNSSAIASIA